MKEKKKQEIPIPFQLDDFYTTQEQRDDSEKERVEEIDISLIDNFKDHPFKVREDEELVKLEESIKTSGVFSPVIIRPKANGRYEMISGHRRKLACKKLGLETIPSIIKNLSDDEAIIFMVDSNMHREKILPSERAFAYKMKYDAIKHQGKSLRPLNQKITSGPVDQKTSAEIIGEEIGESEKTIRRYIRLTYLIPELLDLVDNKELKLEPSIALRPAVEISYLKENEQKILAKYINFNLITPSQSQAMQLRELSNKGLLTEETIDNKLNMLKPNQIPSFKIHEDRLYNVLPKNINREKIEDFVIKACEYYTKHLKQKEMEGR